MTRGRAASGCGRGRSTTPTQGAVRRGRTRFDSSVSTENEGATYDEHRRYWAERALCDFWTDVAKRKRPVSRVEAAMMVRQAGWTVCQESAVRRARLDWSRRCLRAARVIYYGGWNKVSE